VRFHRPSSALAVAVVCLAPAASQAQTISASPYSTSVYNEGPGLHLGSRLLLNLGVAAEIGYDSNVFYRDTDPTDSAMLRVRAHVDLSTASSKPVKGDNSTANPLFDFRLSAQAEYREYLSSAESLKQERSLNLLASTDVGLYPRGPFTLRLVDDYLHTVDPRNQELVGSKYTRDYNRVGLLGSYRSGSFEYGLSDYFNFNYYETSDLKFGNTLADEGEGFVRYHLYSQTLLSLVARLGYVHYTSRDVDPNGMPIVDGKVDGMHTSVDGMPLRVLIGGSSMFTTWLGLTLNVGYGNSFSQEGSSFNNVIGNADLRFILPHAARVNAGYRRDFYDTAIANAYLDDQLYLSFDQPFTRRISAHFDGGVRFRHYIGLADPAVVGAIKIGEADPNSPGVYNPTRDDQVYDLHAELIVRCFSWMVAGLNYNLQADRTDFVIVTGNMMAQVPTAQRYIKHSTFLRIDIAY
jgi:hypothetical protein